MVDCRIMASELIFDRAALMADVVALLLVRRALKWRYPCLARAAQRAAAARDAQA
jgi:hypothetical protein